jgi:hypothetical protein
MIFSLAPDDPAALLSTGRNFGLSPSAVVVPHKPIVSLLILARILFILSIYTI